MTDGKLHLDVDELTRRKRREGEALWAFYQLVERFESDKPPRKATVRDGEITLWEAPPDQKSRR